jgi:hypothetical protein
VPYERAALGYGRGPACAVVEPLGAHGHRAEGSSRGCKGFVVPADKQEGWRDGVAGRPVEGSAVVAGCRIDDGKTASIAQGAIGQYDADGDGPGEKHDRGDKRHAVAEIRPAGWMPADTPWWGAWPVPRGGLTMPQLLCSRRAWSSRSGAGAAADVIDGRLGPPNHG